MLQSNSFKKSGIKKKIFKRERERERERERRGEEGVEREKRGVGGPEIFLVNTIRVCVI